MSADQISAVREFNRLVTQRIEILDENYLKLGRPLSEARLLYEIGSDGAEVRALRQRLKLDSGHLSRLLGSLERQGLLRLHVGVDDARVRRAQLTDAGQLAVAAYDRAADAFAGSMLGPLSLAQRERLLSAMSEVGRLMSVHAIEVGAVAPDHPLLAWCFQEYYAELAERFEGGFDREQYLALAPDSEFVPPFGYALLATLDGRAIGCAALKLKLHNRGEIKRVWTARSVRGLGVGRRMMLEIESLAIRTGLTELILGTNKSLDEAKALYSALGYEEVAPFDDDPFTHVWFAKKLSRQDGA